MGICGRPDCWVVLSHRLVICTVWEVKAGRVKVHSWSVFWGHKKKELAKTDVLLVCVALRLCPVSQFALDLWWHQERLHAVCASDGTEFHSRITEGKELRYILVLEYGAWSFSCWPLLEYHGESGQYWWFWLKNLTWLSWDLSPWHFFYIWYWWVSSGFYIIHAALVNDVNCSVLFIGSMLAVHLMALSNFQPCFGQFMHDTLLCVHGRFL